jgi:hypothetical protein
MLASITPLGERGRQSHWGLTVAAFLIGATGAGAVFGASLGGLGALVVGGLDREQRLAMFVVAALVALVLDLSPRRVPGPRRQVDDRWRDEYRGWVYGLGYGVQLGVGVTTIVSSAATYLALFAAFLSASAGRGAVVVGVFGALRGLQPLLAAPVRRPDQLLLLHARLRRLRPLVRPIGAVLLLGLVALAMVWTLA